MGRDDRRRARDKNQPKLPQTPRRDLAPDGLDIEFSRELADVEDFEAQQRAREAEERVRND